MSYLFFWMASGWHFLLLAVSTCTDWIAGRRISDSADQTIRRRWLVGSLTINLGLLATFKYLDFIIESLNLMALRPRPLLKSIPSDSYCQWGSPSTLSKPCPTPLTSTGGRSKPYERFHDFACYASFFPQLVAGPIIRSHEFLDQIENPKEFSMSKRGWA